MATWTFFNSFKETQLDGSIGTAPIDFDTDTIKVGLITAATAPVAATHDLWNDFTATEVSGTNYTTGGATLTVTVAEAAGTVTVDSDDPQWLESGAGFANARYAILYKDTGTPSTSPLVCFLDFTTDKGNTTGNLTIQMDALGIFTLA